ncbi:MAG: hypothetical protein M1365_07900, partial [Actinobacteria bacterium]|nr:hypothetical protein [Actinomycetota bacterium]
MAQTLSSYLGLSEEALEEKGVVNTIIGVDTHLFLDPFLLKKTTITEFYGSYKALEDYFSPIVTLLNASTQREDRAWKEAYKRLIFKELRGVSIGYGAHSSDGSAIGPQLAIKLVESGLEIIKMGIKDPEIFHLIGLFEDNFGADRLSDMTISIIKHDLYKFTQRIATELGMKNLVEFKTGNQSYLLPKHPLKNSPLIFLPKELLRDLPVALTWEGIDYVVSANQELRNRLNQMIGHSWKNKITKKELRAAIFSDKKNIEALVSAYKSSKAEHYDFKRDPEGEISWYPLGKEFADKNPIQLPKNVKSIDDLQNVVNEMIIQFRKNIEVNGLKEHLYIKNKFGYKRQHERFSQRLFYATADTYCAANNLDLSREPNAGNGPVDFKVSKGYEGRILVEIKLSSNGKLIAGYKKQLPAYEASESTK